MSLLRTVFGSEFQMAGAVQRNAHFAIVVLVNGWHSAGVADRRRRLWTSRTGLPHIGSRAAMRPVSFLHFGIILIANLILYFLSC